MSPIEPSTPVCVYRSHCLVEESAHGHAGGVPAASTVGAVGEPAAKTLASSVVARSTAERGIGEVLQRNAAKGTRAASLQAASRGLHPRVLRPRESGDTPMGTELLIMVPLRACGANRPRHPCRRSRAGHRPTVIDVRTSAEFAAGHLDGAVNLDVEGGECSAGITQLDPSATSSVYCQSGRRSALAAAAMVEAGFARIYDMGGIQGWRAAGLPVVAG